MKFSMLQENIILKNLFKEFTCTICLQLFNDPVTVSLCKHTYCQDCLKQWKFKSDKSNCKTFKCPLCKNTTTKRSYYTNEKYAIAVKFLHDLSIYMESKCETDKSIPHHEEKNQILEKYLNDCIKYKLDYANDVLEINDVDDVLITESEENEYILNICSTAENINIINKLENDFINDLEKETNDKECNTPSPANKKTDNNKTNSAKKSGWSRIKTINRNIKKTNKYKKLKVTETKTKNESIEKKGIRTRSSKNKIPPLDDFDEYIKEKSNVKDLNPDDEQINDDDIFFKSTQILNLEKLNPEVSIIKLGKRKSSENSSPIKKIKTPEKNEIIVSADVHHSNDSEIDVPVKNKQLSQNINNPDSNIIENSEEINATKSKPIEDSNLVNLNKEFVETLKKVTELKSSVLLNLEQNLKESENILTEYSNLIYNSDSLFSNDSVGKQSKKSSPNKQKLKSSINNICSVPTLNVTSKENITFYNTAIPCLKKIREYYQQLKILSSQFTESSAPTINNDNEKKDFSNIQTQTDILKCPTCTYTFNLKSALNIPSKETESNSDDFNVFLEDVKKNLSKKDSLPSITENSNSSVIQDKSSKKRFKRIRTASDSDSDESSDHSKRSKNSSYQSKLLYRDDIDVCFHSSTSQFHTNVEQKNKSGIIENNKSSEDTLLYLEQQYKNPIGLPVNKNATKDNPEKNTTNTNIDNLLSGIDISTFETDFINTNKNNDVPEKLSASLFTETQAVKYNNPQLINKTNITVHNIDPDDDSIVNDSCESDEIFDDDIVDTTPQKNIENKRINETEVKSNTNCLTSNSQISLRKLQNQTIPLTTPDILPLPSIDLNCGFFDNTKTQITQLQSQQQNDLSDSNVHFVEPKILNPILIAQNNECSPLQLVKQQNNKNTNKTKSEPVKHQSSILGFVTTPQTNNINSPRHIKSTNQTQMNISNNDDNNHIVERCESPVLHSRPSAAIIISTSRLQSKDNATIMTYASRMNARYSNVFNKNITHLIVKVDENNCVADQTIKYLLAIAHGIWVLNYSWFKDSINKNRLLPEEPYEVLDMSGNPGPRLSRLKRKELPIFKKFIFYIAEPVVTTTKNDLEDVIINLGGIVVISPDDFQKYPEEHCLILCEGKCYDDYETFELWKNKYMTMIVDIEWLSESVGRFGIASIRSYALCSDNNIENFCYPPELIAPIPESEMDIL